MYDLDEVESKLYSDSKLLSTTTFDEVMTVSNPFKGVKTEKLRKRPLKFCVIILNNQHGSFIMTPLTMYVIFIMCDKCMLLNSFNYRS